VSVYYPPDAVGREIKINDGPWMPITDITKNDQIIMDENGKIEARAIDEAGNISEVAELEIKNIDKFLRQHRQSIQVLMKLQSNRLRRR